MSTPPLPPIRRTAPKAAVPTTKPSWKDKAKSWGSVGLEKGFVISDWVGGHANSLATKVCKDWLADGAEELGYAASAMTARTADQRPSSLCVQTGNEHFYPVTGDFVQEIEVCIHTIHHCVELVSLMLWFALSCDVCLFAPLRHAHWKKCARILRAFTVDGLEVKVEPTSAIMKQQKVLRKM